MILEFLDVAHFTDVTSTTTFQIKLFETTNDIEIHYTRAPADNRPHVSGMEDQTGSDGITVYRGFGSLPQESAVRFQRASAIDRYTLSLDAGQEITLQTATPFDSPTGHLVPNTLNPEINVYAPDGSLVASDLDSLDGKNARLTMVAAETGVFTVEVNATSGIGDYALELYEPATIDNVTFGDGTEQRSRVNEIAVEFDQIVELQPGAFQLNQRLSGGALGDQVGLATPMVDNSSGASVVTLSFTGTDIVGGSLYDGNFVLTIFGNNVLVAGRPMDGDNDGVAGGDFVRGQQATDSFFRLFGDTNGSRTVSLTEVAQARTTFGSVEGEARFNGRFDYDGNGGIGIVDIANLRTRFGSTLDFD